MIQSLIHTTENNNSYIYDDQSRLSILIHPEIKKAHKKTTDADPYYLGKYAYLSNHNFFSKPKLANFGTLEESMVKATTMQVRQIVFEVTDCCNLNCSYCAFGELYEGFDARNFKNINIQYAIILLKYIFDLKPKNKKNKLYIGFYGGEPLLNADFIKQIVEVVNQLKSEKELDIGYSMTTNATLIHKHIHFLVENNFRLLISLDGNEKGHSYRTFAKNKKNSFRKVIENMDMIQRNYPEYFTNSLNFNAILHNRNSVKDIYEFIYTRYHKIPRISELSLNDTNPDKKTLHDKMYHSKRQSEDEYQQEEFNQFPHNELVSYKELTDFLKYLSINFYISHITPLLYDEEKHFPTSTCWPFEKKIYLTTRNKLLPCERINFKFSMGNVDQNVNIDIHEITKKYNSYLNHVKQVCQYCYAYKFCGICLFHIKNIDKSNTEEFVCEWFYDQKAFQNKLYRVFSFLEKYPDDFSQILENVIIEE